MRHGRPIASWFFVGPFRFRSAVDPDPGANLRRSLRQLVIFWVVFFGLIPAGIAWLEARLGLDSTALDTAGVEAAGAVLLVVGSVFGFAAMRAMARHGRGTPLPSAHAVRLVTAGPYGWVRNPMAVAGALQAAGVGALWGSWLVWVATAVGGVFWHVVVRPVEEDDLLVRFGATYEDYRARTGLWIPRRVRPR